MLFGPIQSFYDNILKNVQSDRRSKEYEDRFVVFLDILGMRSKLKELSYTDMIKAYNTIESVFRLYDNMGIVSAGKFTDYTNITIMSDSIVISHPAKNDQSFASIVGFSLCMMQTILFSISRVEPVFFRGGISRGLLYHDNLCVFGPALVSAYELEKNHANNMRVIADESITTSKLYKNYLLKNPGIFIKDNDGYPFLNFLLNPNGAQTMRTDLKQFVRSKIAELTECHDEDSEKLLSKMKWCNHYLKNIDNETLFDKP